MWKWLWVVFWKDPKSFGSFPRKDSPRYIWIDMHVISMLSIVNLVSQVSNQAEAHLQCRK